MSTEPAAAQVTAHGRELLQSLINVEKPALAPHCIPPDSTGARESHQPGNREVLGGVQLGLPMQAVLYVTERPPDQIQWPTFDDAKQNGIEVGKFPP